MNIVSRFYAPSTHLFYRPGGLVLSFIILITNLAMPVSNVHAATALVDDLVGTFGDINHAARTEVNRIVEESGIEAAASQAEATVNGLAEGAVPFIDELSSPYQENAQQAITRALSQVQTATNILNRISAQGATRAIDFIRNSPLFTGADFGITTPTGRMRIHVQGTDVSLCRTIVGPLGTVIVTGISNAENLCNFPDERMSNPTRSLLAFTYIAAGHTHVRTNQVLIPNLAEDLTRLPAPITAETYVQTIGGQWVQIRLAGADPASLELEAKFEVGIKGNGSYYVDIEAEGEAALKVSLKPIYAAEVIRSTGEVMLNEATSLGLDMEAANFASDTAAILRAGLQHLSDIEPQYEEGFGEVSIDVKMTGGIGVGAWDTAISGISANSTFNLSYPLHAFIEMRAGLLEEFLDITLGMVNVNLNLGIAVLEGNGAAGLETFKNDARLASTEFVDGVLDELLVMSTHIDTESTFTLSLLGDADKESITLYHSGLVLPVGDISASLQTHPNAFGDAFAAIAHLMQATIDPDVVIPQQVWDDLDNVIVPGILYTLQVRSPVDASLTGFNQVDLLQTIQVIASVRQILIDVVRSSQEDNLDSLRSTIETVITSAINNADDQVIDWLNDASIPRSWDIGANGSLGAEAVAELGVSVEVKGEVKAGLFLLLLGLDVYNGTHNTVLSSAAMPIDFSLDAGASAGEGVEVTLDAGGRVSFNLFELSARHWDAELPSPALMDVAGFSVLEFDGLVNQDGSFAGSGYLMLPMGGLVSAEFVVDPDGNVVSGSWSGGMELGPLGNYPFLSGALDDDGLHGSVDVAILGTEFSADFILSSSGLLFGSYDGAITIAGHELAAASINLDPDGTFSGAYQGDIDIGGFTTSTDLTFNNDGFAGRGYLNILGSELVATDLAISRSGYITGSFSGDIQAGPHTLSAVSLQVGNGGLVGTALLDLPGVIGAEVELRIFDGRIIAYYQGDLLNGLITQASFSVNDTGIVMSANFNTGGLPGIGSEVLNWVAAGASLAQDGLEQAQIDLAAAQSVVDGLEQQLIAASSQLTADLEAAQQALLDATAEAQAALNELNSVFAQIQAINNAYQGLISDAQLAVNQAQQEVNRARNLVNYYNSEISRLDRWYNGLSNYNKAYYSIYYSSRRAQLVTYRTAAIAALRTAQLALDGAQLALNALNSELADLLNPLELTRQALQTAYELADASLTAAQDNLAAIEADIVSDTLLQPIYDALDAARYTLGQAQQLVDTLSGKIAMAEYLATHGAETTFTVLSTHMTTSLSGLMSGNSIAVDARVVFMGQPGRVRLAFDPLNPVSSFQQLVTDLLTGTAVISNSDSVAPGVMAIRPDEWTHHQTLIKLLAEDNVGGTGIASITFSASGAQLIAQTTVAGAEAYVLINTEGLTTVSFYATDVNGNSSEITTISASVDNSGPQISITPVGINEGVYEVMISATDLLGSGIEYIAVSARGVENFVESIQRVDEAVMAFTKQGFTTLTVTAVDVAGNITRISHDLEVPDLSVAIEEPPTGQNGNNDDSTNTDGNADSGASGSGSSGGSMNMLWILFVLMSLGLRGLPLRLKQQRG